MVSNKPTQKKPKLTYSARTLKAAYDATKGRHGGAHINTIRARVRKNAQQDDDPLGPNWSTYVKKAVHNLGEESGMIDATDVTNIRLTPAAKQRISTHRRADGYNISSNDDLFWKRVSQPPCSGTKRARIMAGVDDDARSPSRSPSAKRARRSSGTSASSRMTKLELQERLAAMTRAYEDALKAPNLDRSASSDSEEVRHLQEALQEQRARVEELEAQIEQAGQQDMDMDLPQQELDDAVFVRPETPRPLPRSEEPGSPVLIIRNARSLHGMTRTQSGSFIHHLSKQPTPDPGSPPSIHDAPMPDSWGTTEESQLFATPPNLQMPITPDPSPRRPSVDHVSLATSRLSDSLEKTQKDLKEKEDEILRLQAIQDNTARTAEALKDAQAQASLLQDRVDELERIMVEREMLVTSQETEISELGTAKAQAEKSLANLNAELALARDSLTLREQTISKLNTSAGRLTERIEELEKALEDATIDGSKRLVEEKTARMVVQRELEQLRLQTTSLQARYEGSTIQIDNLRARLEQVEALATDRLKYISSLTDEKSKIEKELECAISEANMSRERAGELDKLNEMLHQALQEQLEASETTAASLRTELDQSALEFQKMRDEQSKTMEALRLVIAERDETIKYVKASEKAAIQELDLLRKQYARTSSELDATKKRTVELQNLGNEERARSAALELELEKIRRSLDEANEEILDYKASKAQDDATIASLKASFAKLHEIQMQSLSQLANEFDSAHASPVRRPRRSI